MRVTYWLRNGVSVSLIFFLLALAPFAVALDVHHELAAADQDGHEHSDNDLCQWVQQHTAGSLDDGVPLFTVQERVLLLERAADPPLFSVDLSSLSPSRAPPRG